MKYLIITGLLMTTTVYAEKKEGHTYCDVCGKDLTRDDSVRLITNYPVSTEIGLAITTNEGALEYDDVVQKFGKAKFAICVVDLLKAMGVKEKRD